MLSRLIVLVTLVFCGPCLAQDLADAAGSADPENLPRIEGAIIIGYDQSGFDELGIIKGKVSFGGAEDEQVVEGPRTRIIYVIPGDRSPLEVIRNYEAELLSQGYEQIYQCGGQGCGKPAAMTKFLYPLGGKLENYGQLTEYAFSSPRDDQRYLAMGNAQTGRTVSVYTAFETFDLDERTADKTLVLLDVIDGDGLQQRMEFVTAEGMAKGLSEAGHIALYGLQFDHDSDVIMPGSKPTLEEIARFLLGAGDVSVFVVGHTDMSGAYEYNMDLSRRRAAAVMKALAETYGVPRARLTASGVGPLAPVGDNETPQGRARNRRVELVRR